jgi:hypothetical protein
MFCGSKRSSMLMALIIGTAPMLSLSSRLKVSKKALSARSKFEAQSLAKGDPAASRRRIAMLKQGLRNNHEETSHNKTSQRMLNNKRQGQDEIQKTPPTDKFVGRLNQALDEVQSANSFVVSGKANSSMSAASTWWGFALKGPSSAIAKGGRAACENHGFGQKVCNSIGCCTWNGKSCESAVGQSPCGSYSRAQNINFYNYFHSEGHSQPAAPSFDAEMLEGEVAQEILNKEAHDIKNEGDKSNPDGKMGDWGSGMLACANEVGEALQDLADAYTDVHTPFFLEHICEHSSVYLKVGGTQAICQISMSALAQEFNNAQNYYRWCRMNVAAEKEALKQAAAYFEGAKDSLDVCRKNCPQFAQIMVSTLATFDLTEKLLRTHEPDPNDAQKLAKTTSSICELQATAKCNMVNMHPKCKGLLRGPGPLPIDLNLHVQMMYDMCKSKKQCVSKHPDFDKDVTDWMKAVKAMNDAKALAPAPAPGNAVASPGAPGGAPPPHGEDACERHGFTKEQCLSVGCCHWNEEHGPEYQTCWSSVGQSSCLGYYNPVGDAVAGAPAGVPAGPMSPAEIKKANYKKFMNHANAPVLEDKAMCEAFDKVSRSPDCTGYHQGVRLGHWFYDRYDRQCDLVSDPCYARGKQTCAAEIAALDEPIESDGWFEGSNCPFFMNAIHSEPYPFEPQFKAFLQCCGKFFAVRRCAEKMPCSSFYDKLLKYPLDITRQMSRCPLDDTSVQHGLQLWDDGQELHERLQKLQNNPPSEIGEYPSWREETQDLQMKFDTKQRDVGSYAECIFSRRDVGPDGRCDTTTTTTTTQKCTTISAVVKAWGNEWRWTLQETTETWTDGAGAPGAASGGAPGAPGAAAGGAPSPAPGAPDASVQGSSTCSGGPYSSHATYDQNCCLREDATYELSCVDTFGDGWNGGFITVGTRAFCENTSWRRSETHTFKGSEVMR